MRHGRHRFYGFGFGFSPFGMFFRGGRPFPRRDEYIRMLEEYRDELREELQEVERELAELKKEG